MTDNTHTSDLRILALSRHLDTEPDEILEAPYGEHYFIRGSEEYRVLTDDEADDAAREYIEETVWAFRPEFLSGYVCESLAPDDIRGIIGNRCEDANPAILALVEAGEGLDALVRAALASDGRGHFIAHYDGEEHEVQVGDMYFYVVRVN